MGWFNQSYEQSRIGQLLVKQNLITEEQLARAIELQGRTGQRLGDIFAEWNIVTQKHVQEALRKQRNLRLAATIATALLAPLETVVAAPVTPVTQQVTSASTGTQSSMQPMTEEDLGGTSARGLSEELTRRISERSHSKGDGLAVLGGIAQAFNPLLGFLDANVTMKDVTYDPANATSMINPDGSITLRMPTTIGELHFENIRVHGSSPNGPSFGSITMRDIDFRGTTVMLKPF